MIKRVTQKRTEYDLIKLDKGINKQLCVFVHGYGGDHKKSYWGILPGSLGNEQSLENIDICFWGYSSSKNPLANIFSILRRGKNISELELVAASLDTAINEICEEHGYETVDVVGHSMGGLVALLCYDDEKIGKGAEKIRRISLLATPLCPPKLGKIKSFLCIANPHVRLMFDRVKMNHIFSVTLPNINKCGVHTTYMCHTRDELLNQSNLDDLDNIDVKYLDENHHWFLTGSQRDSAYRSLLDWMAKRTAQ